MADAAARKVSELEDRLGRVEETLEGQGGRLDLVELRGTRESIRVTAARVLANEVHDALMGMSAVAGETWQKKVEQQQGPANKGNPRGGGGRVLTRRPHRVGGQTWERKI